MKRDILAYEMHVGCGKFDSNALYFKTIPYIKVEEYCFIRQHNLIFIILRRNLLNEV